MSEDAQMRLKRGAMKGGLSSKEGTREPTEEEVKEKGFMPKESQVTKSIFIFFSYCSESFKYSMYSVFLKLYIK
jgi:hypothetical protein